MGTQHVGFPSTPRFHGNLGSIHFKGPPCHLVEVQNDTINVRDRPNVIHIPGCGVTLLNEFETWAGDDFEKLSLSGCVN